MATGDFFIQFFTERQGTLNEPNFKKEVNVLCPFTHSKGYETRPSAHINLTKGTFHCKVCEAEGRFINGGLSEVGFISKLYSISYKRAIAYLHLDEQQASGEELDADYSRTIQHLLDSEKDMNHLKNRGITRQAIIEYKLGYSGTGVTYPILVNGMLVDMRTYNTERQPHEPKMVSRKNAPTALFPFDHWKQDNRPTVLCAGENDTLLARILGFNGITSTGGEGRFPESFAPYFTGKKVYICYDCDEAGKHGGKVAGHILKIYGAEVYMVDLQLPGTKEEKDLTDYIIKLGNTALDFQERLNAALPFDSKDDDEIKKERFPYIELDRIADGEHTGQQRSTRVVLSGIYDQAMQVPVAVEFGCSLHGKNDYICPNDGISGTWILDDNLRDVMKLVELSDENQKKTLRSILGQYEKCRGCWSRAIAKEPVYKVIFTPDVDTMNEGHNVKLVEQYAYTVGLNKELEDGNKYRAYFRAYPHPKDQRVFMVVDRLEESDNSVNAFKMSEEIHNSLLQFQGDPFERMADRAKRMHSLTRAFKPYKLVADAYNVLYHSVIKFRFGGKDWKGNPEFLIAGAPRTGKTETGKTFQDYIGLGNTTSVKAGSTAGLLGGADRLPNGGWRVNWGTIPRNNGGLVIMDEFSGLSREVFATLTDVRSSCIAKVEKIAKGRALAHTRLAWVGNQREINGRSRDIEDYANVVELVLDLVGTDEDLARFDACVIVPKVPEGQQGSIMDIPELDMYDREACRNLVCWVWSRKPNQVVFDEKVDRYIEQVSKELNAKFYYNHQFFGPETWKKVCRIAIGCAACCYSCTSDSECVLVRKSHVDWAVDFLCRCYDNPLFRLVAYTEKKWSLSQTNEAVNNLVAGICRQHGMLVRTLMEATDYIALGNLQTICGITDRDKFSQLIQKMGASYLININANKGIMPTQRMRKAVAAYEKTGEELEITPLAEERRYSFL